MTSPVRVWLGLGSNVDRERNLCAAVQGLRMHFGSVYLSPVYESRAVGFVGNDFLNLVAGIDTGLAVGELQAVLRALEEAGGRVRGAARFSDRTLDIDLLTWGDVVGVVDGVALPRAEIVENAFVLRPLAAVAPDGIHPGLGVAYRDLWARGDFTAQPLREVFVAGLSGNEPGRPIRACPATERVSTR